MRAMSEVPGSQETVNAILDRLAKPIDAGVRHWHEHYEGPCVVIVIDMEEKPAIRLAMRSFREAIEVDRGRERYVVLYLEPDDLQRRLEHLGTSVPMQCGMTIEAGRVPCFLATLHGLVFATMKPTSPCPRCSGMGGPSDDCPFAAEPGLTSDAPRVLVSCDCCATCRRECREAV